MADDSSSPATVDPNSHKPGPSTPNPLSTPPPQQQLSQPQIAPLDPTKPPIFQPGPPYAPSGSLVPNLPPPPPFRPGVQFTQASNYQTPNSGVPPPPPPPPGSIPYPGQPMRPFTPMANGYPGIHGVPPPGGDSHFYDSLMLVLSVHPGGICTASGVHIYFALVCGLVRYPSLYPTMVRPGFITPPPGTVGAVPLVQRPLIPGMPGLRPVMSPMTRPALVPFVLQVEKPQTTIYIGKIATVENDFMMSILEFCGHVKSCKRAEDPTTKKPKGFGFYEFESAEESLRAIRLLTKLTIDGQELLVNVNQATKEYLLKYVEKKIDNAKKAKESQAVGTEDNQGEKAVISAAPTVGEMGKDGEPKSKENIDIANSAVLTDEEREADKEAKEKIDNAIEERSKANPLPPPPPPPPADGSGIELAFKSRDGDSNTDIARSESAANDVETPGEHNRPDTSSPDWSKRNDRRSRDRGEKEQEMDRHEREAERERLRKEREHRRKLEDAERAYQTRLRQWERKEREKEKERQYEKEKEKDKERKRKKEIRYEEEEDEDDVDSRRRWHRGADERRRRRLREKEDDLADRLKEEVAEAKRIAEEEKLQQQQLDALRLLSGHAVIGSEPSKTTTKENDNKAALQTVGESVHEQHRSDIEQNGSGNEMSMAVDNNSGSEAHAPSKKLGFGLFGSGKRTSVPSVFCEEDEEEAHKDKKMKPLVPIDYSAEEQEAVAHGGSGNTPPHLALAAEFAKRISSTNPKEETADTDTHRSRRSLHKPSHREREREKNRDRARDRGDGHGDGKDSGTAKTPDTKKLMDAKQLIDTIPKTKEELFSYEINWAMYDQHQLHERMRPWISKKIMEFLGEEEATLVDFIVSNTQQHVKASKMLELLQSILDEEAEMFVLKMWRMLIFEIKRVEAGVR
ncbi:hypothetical protein HID58_060043 [Brassica napus]|uniref:RNA-binding protein 25 n=1 Tax=Brassica napus TaxID=3708 RepID=A0ABQ7ZUM8_BRANA|nr:hypothetical protein HID58_060043 [Brassica napus]